jgi:hypothetical protein
MSKRPDTWDSHTLEAVPAWGVDLLSRFEKLRSIVERQLVANQRDRERVAALEKELQIIHDRLGWL